MGISPEKFEALVAGALDGLPDEIAEAISNVEVVIEDLPRRGDAGRPDEPANLLGLYEGIPLTQRGPGYFGVLPDRITLYRRNIERAGGTFAGIREVVRRTVIHEVAHHFGIDDDRLAELGWD